MMLVGDIYGRPRADDSNVEIQLGLLVRQIVI